MRLNFIYNISLLLFFLSLSFVNNAQFIEDNFDQYQYQYQGWSTFNSGVTNNTFCIIDSVYSISGKSLQVCSVVDKLYNQIDVLQSGYTYASGLQSEIKYRKIETANYFNIQVGFDWKCNGEEGHDFGSLQYSTDGENWRVLKNYQSGKGNEVMTEMLKMPKCSENGYFFIGFSFTSDNSFNFQPGLVVDNFKVFGDSCPQIKRPKQPTPNKDLVVCSNDEKKVDLTATSSTNNLRWYSKDKCDAFLFEGKEYGMFPTKDTTLFVSSYDPTTGCESDLKSKVNLIVRDLPKLKETIVVNATYGLDGSIKIKVSGYPPLEFMCSSNSKDFKPVALDIKGNSNFSDPTDSTLLLDSLNMGNYKITVTDKYQCKDSFKIVVLSGAELDIPKGISPNNDGLNDVWKISGIEQWEDFSVELRNMRGELVYRQDATDYPAYVPMDGKDSSGLKLPPGDYTYVIRSKSRKRNYSGILSIKYD